MMIGSIKKYSFDYAQRKFTLLLSIIDLSNNQPKNEFAVLVTAFDENNERIGAVKFNVDWLNFLNGLDKSNDYLFEPAFKMFKNKDYMRHLLEKNNQTSSYDFEEYLIFSEGEK